MTIATPPIDVLFVSERALWPPDQGFRVHGPQMARALAARGLRVKVATAQQTPDEAPNWLKNMLVGWPHGDEESAVRAAPGWNGALRKLRARVAERQGVELSTACELGTLIAQHRPAVVVGLDQRTPILLAALGEVFPQTARMWYAADELAYFHLSCLKREPVERWKRRSTEAALHGVIERLFGGRLEGIVAVSPMDQRLLSLVSGNANVGNVPNGVDLSFFKPRPEGVAVKPRSLVFWGGMDFEPNIDAVCWFGEHVWPRLRARHVDATWQIVGRNPSRGVKRVGRMPGVELTGAMPDVREQAWRGAVTVLPMRCGGGIKNKLLEASAMGLAMVASPRAVRGLNLPVDKPAMLVCQTPREWVSEIERLWENPELGAELGESARHWVERDHSWATAAEGMVRLFERARPSGRWQAPADGHNEHLAQKAA